MDIWQYIKLENIALPELYFSHERECFVRNGVIMAVTEYTQPQPEETVEKMQVRFVRLVNNLYRCKYFDGK